MSAFSEPETRTRPLRDALRVAQMRLNALAYWQDRRILGKDDPAIDRYVDFLKEDLAQRLAAYAEDAVRERDERTAQELKTLRTAVVQAELRTRPDIERLAGALGCKMPPPQTDIADWLWWWPDPHHFANPPPPPPSRIPPTRRF